ncbi:hypothetical protein BDV37DRAFT_291662 [Aspergillus pseudonomiae]|uniref:FAD-binding PCMH-type domain-containing protein n=1 Tax=Aspergillus pseudonomiae TaxID=1506151 RepID=A0A5N7CUC3_9EURO|nr:uncharacterized protein BDV37DRAFT_291662 [Aspergillus pseudonomiae]KAE8397782.1 hypothetical protein BDV37DRAFT_291662 [Aspergillus pseudonomiae]
MGTRSILVVGLAVAQFAIGSALPSYNAFFPTSLQSCLSKTGAEIVYPTDQTYESLSKPQNSNYQASPEVIVVPASTEHVAATVKCVAVKKGNVTLSPRGGGHSYAAYSFSGQVVLDPSHMRRISIDDARRTATVQFGQTLGPLATALGKRGYALPHGTCPTVGVAGHSMGGGWGFPSRKWGWLVDRIVGLEFVDVNGNIKQLSPSSTGQDAELWWALRGAGSNNFGVVTAFTFSLEQAPANVVNYELYFGPESDCVQVLLQVQGLGQLPADSPDGLPLDLGIEVLLMGRDNNQGSACILQGQYLGKRSAYETAMNKILQKLAARGIKPVRSESKVKEFNSWVAALTDLMGPLEAPDAPLPYYAQSAIDNGAPAYDKNQVKLIFDGLRAARQTKGSEPDVSFDLLGPDAKTNLPTSSGDMAYIHRTSLFLVQIYSAYFPGFGDSAARQDAVNKVTRITSAVRMPRPGSEWHSYQNYIDPHLANFGREYYGGALERLKAIKAAADPDVVFDFPQGLSHV